MGKQAKGSAGAVTALRQERIFLNNGGMLIPRFVEKRSVERDGLVTEYIGVGGVLICDVRESHVACRAQMDIPKKLVKVPSSAQPGAPLIDAETFPAGEVVVIGYKF